jgi:hypothetical protein
MAARYRGKGATVSTVNELLAFPFLKFGRATEVI